MPDDQARLAKAILDYKTQYTTAAANAAAHFRANVTRAAVAVVAHNTARRRSRTRTIAMVGVDRCRPVDPMGSVRR
jgi:hypothetical protein